MVGTGIGLILSFLIVVGGVSPLVDTSAGDAPNLIAQTNTAPFGAGEVTTPDLTPERFAAALPEQFGGAEREYLGFVPVEEQVHGFSTTSEEFLYYDPATVTDVWVIINDLGSEPTVRSAVESVAVGIEVGPEFEIEQQSTSSAAAVPFLLANQNQSLYALVWGARGGDWVFASSASIREEFVRTLVENLQPARATQGSAASTSNTGLIDALLSTPLDESSFPLSLAANIQAGADIGTPLIPEYFNGFMAGSPQAWLQFPVQTSIFSITYSTIEYGIYETNPDAQLAFDEIVRFVESRRLPSSELFLNEDYIDWFDVVGGNSAVGGTIRRVDNVIILGYASWMDFTIIGPGDKLTTGLLMEVGVNHLDGVRSSLSSSAPDNAGVESEGTFPGVTFTPQHLDVQLGDTVAVEVAMANTDFGGLYDLNLLIPPQFQLASDPVCISNAESCINFEPDVIPQLDGSIAIVISGYYGLSEPGRFALDLDVVDVPQTGGPRVVISAQLVFYTRHVEHEPVDTWLEVNFE